MNIFAFQNHLFGVYGISKKNEMVKTVDIC